MMPKAIATWFGLNGVTVLILPWTEPNPWWMLACTTVAGLTLLGFAGVLWFGATTEQKL